jgi:hypothetical protein
MARRIESDTVTGLREYLTQRCADLLARFTDEGCGAEVRRLRGRLDDLTNNRDVLVYRFELPADQQPPRADGQHIYTLRGDRLIPAQYESTQF